MHERGKAHRRFTRQLARDVEHLQRVNAGVDLGVPLLGLRHAEQAIDLRQQRGERTALAQHLEVDRRRLLAQRALGFDPDAFGHQRPHLAGAHDVLHQLHRLGRDREAERREARSETRDTQHAQRVFDESGRDVAQDTSLEVTAATVRVDDVAAAIVAFDRSRHRVDREVTPREVFLERHVGREARGEAVVAGTGLAFGPGERVLVAALRMQEDGKVLADGTVAEREQVVGPGADDHVVAFGEGPSEQRVAHGTAHQVSFHC